MASSAVRERSLPPAESRPARLSGISTVMVFIAPLSNSHCRSRPNLIHTGWCFLSRISPRLALYSLARFGPCLTRTNAEAIMFVTRIIHPTAIGIHAALSERRRSLRRSRHSKAEPARILANSPMISEAIQARDPAPKSAGHIPRPTDLASAPSPRKPKPFSGSSMVSVMASPSR